MTHFSIIITSLAVAFSTAIGVAGNAVAAERVAKIDAGFLPDGSRPASVQPTSTDANSRFVSIVLNKSIALDLPRDVKDIFIGNEKIANAVLRSKRRAYIIAAGLGQTNIFFYDENGEQIEGLNVNVADHVVLERLPSKEIVVVRGAAEDKGQFEVYECVPVCSLAENAAPDKNSPAPVFVLPNVTSVTGGAKP